MRTVAGLLALLWAPFAAAGQVVCHYTYGGEPHALAAHAVASPYGVTGTRVGSYFRFRVVVQDTPAELASVKIYTYVERDEGPTLIHQASYRYPPAGDAGAPYGFTGLHFVYEPVRDSEIQYWCGMATDGGAAR